MSASPRTYSPREEWANVITHGAGSVLSIAGLVAIVTWCAWRGDAWQVASTAVFGVTLVLLYGASTLYHRARPGDETAAAQVRSCGDFPVDRGDVYAVCVGHVARSVGLEFVRRGVGTRGGGRGPEVLVHGPVSSGVDRDLRAHGLDGVDRDQAVARGDGRGVVRAARGRRGELHGRRGVLSEQAAAVSSCGVACVRARRKRVSLLRRVAHAGGDVGVGAARS
ncbi:hemolysin III family protein [Horticoccus luteus]|uniref:Hemolysin III family protein n=1 Tax=Horticoccus luteus TaxID=2862869 RepID=A0A8F9TVA2_9BACT|nr:hemolysin III family protein [Horticoccus luteus]